MANSSYGTKTDIRLVQHLLRDLGFPLEVDGVAGPITRRTLELVSTETGAKLLVDADTDLRTLRGLGSSGWTRGSGASSDGRSKAVTCLERCGLDRVFWFSGLVPKLDEFFESVRVDATSDERVALAAEWLFDQDVRERRQNRGDWVDVIVELGGGNASNASPWCARFVAACRELGRASGGPHTRFYKTGSAISTWSKAKGARIQGFPDSEIVVRGAAFSRLRSSVDDDRVKSDLEAVWHRSQRRKGHTGIVVGRTSSGDLLCIAGNSSGSGHSTASSHGRVAMEVVGPSGNRHARGANDRLVGLSFVRTEA